MISPLEIGNLTTTYDPPGHWGIDLGFKGIVDPPIKAWRKGLIIQSLFSITAGNVIVIRHDLNTQWTMMTRYLHLKKRLVLNGQTVEEGQVIGIGGTTGTTSTGPHLHWEMMIVPMDKALSGYNVDLKPLCAFDPRAMLPTNTLIGEGIHMIKLNPAILPTARPSVSDLRYRIGPSIKAKVMGIVKDTDHPFMGVTDPISEIENGKAVSIQWAKLVIEDLIVYASLDYLKVTEPKIREPLHAVFNDGTIMVKVDTV